MNKQVSYKTMFGATAIVSALTIPIAIYLDRRWARKRSGAAKVKADVAQADIAPAKKPSVTFVDTATLMQEVPALTNELISVLKEEDHAGFKSAMEDLKLTMDEEFSGYFVEVFQGLKAISDCKKQGGKPLDLYIDAIEPRLMTKLVRARADDNLSERDRVVSSQRMVMTTLEIYAVS